jgi:hypothetical protein
MDNKSPQNLNFQKKGFRGFFVIQYIWKKNPQKSPRNLVVIYVTTHALTEGI